MKDFSTYRDLEKAIADLKHFAESGNWEEAAQISTQIAVSLSSSPALSARPEDRAAIEASLASLAEVGERASALRGDMDRLLRAFDGTGGAKAPA